MNKIVDICRERENIISLWHQCFGDGRDYIEFFFDNCPNKICLGSFENGKLASMLFLLNGKIGGLSCKYLYAACTAEEYRCRGIMGRLIGYAKDFCRSQGVDCIFLVPSSESLYGYYEKFGFSPMMKRAEMTLHGGGEKQILSKNLDIKHIASQRIRFLSKIKCFSFDEKTTEYSVAEFLKTGGEIYSRGGENGFLAFASRNGNNIVIKEFLTDFDNNITVFFDLFENLGAENVYIYAPLVYNDSDNGCRTTKCGMLFPISEKAKDCINEDDIFYSGMYLD